MYAAELLCWIIGIGVVGYMVYVMWQVATSKRG
jgi:preprotein translocase subunit Sss1